MYMYINTHTRMYVLSSWGSCPVPLQGLGNDWDPPRLLVPCMTCQQCSDNWCFLFSVAATTHHLPSTSHHFVQTPAGSQKACHLPEVSPGLWPLSVHLLLTMPFLFE